jgi:hypothetical protein
MSGSFSLGNKGLIYTRPSLGRFEIGSKQFIPSAQTSRLCDMNTNLSGKLIEFPASYRLIKSEPSWGITCLDAPAFVRVPSSSGRQDVLDTLPACQPFGSSNDLHILPVIVVSTAPNKQR